jgi:hypothetical protein
MSKRKTLVWILLLIALITLPQGCAQSARSSVTVNTRIPIAPAAIPDAIGVNIHFTDPQPGEMKLLAASGVRWVRTDFYWQNIETEKGRYDFSPYDRLISTLEQYHLRAVLILDYSNKLYDEGRSPHTAEGRAAFARWTAAAAQHFRGRGILWEIYNEPNIRFWTPYPNVDDYTALALESARAIHAAAPEESIIGPASSLIDFAFLEKCFQAGLLEYWSAVSVHPYRKGNPESVVEEYAHLRRMIDVYAPKNKNIPIISGEWGYSSVWRNLDEQWQSIMLARELLINQAQGIKLSIWYDWHDDGDDPKELEHHWGLVSFPYNASRDPVFETKASYRAMQTLNTRLGGYVFSNAVPSAADDYVLAFKKDQSLCFVAWTTSANPHTATIDLKPGTYRILTHTGELIGSRTVTGHELTLTITSAPIYITE